MSKRKRLVAALVTLIAAPGFAASMPKEAEAAYQAARTGYYALKRDEGRRRFRHNWLPVIKRFEAVAAKFPKSDRAPDALFTAGQTLEELSRISRLEEDLTSAMADYQRLIETAPRHKLADDAAYQLARIELDRLARSDDARKTASHALELQPKGDRAKDLRALLDSLPEDKKLAVKPTVKLVPTPDKDVEEATEGNKIALVAAIEKLARSQGRTAADSGKSAGSEDGDSKQPDSRSKRDESKTSDARGNAADAKIADSRSNSSDSNSRVGSGDSKLADSRASSGDSKQPDSRSGRDESKTSDARGSGADSKIADSRSNSSDSNSRVG
ncbi:MAG: tetratricopeptide repeat protein, partial [Myxococcaceae bacterium]